MYTILLTDASPCNRSTPCDVTDDVYMRTCGQMTDMSWPVQVLLCTAKYSTEHMLHRPLHLDHLLISSTSLCALGLRFFGL